MLLTQPLQCQDAGELIVCWAHDSQLSFLVASSWVAAKTVTCYIHRLEICVYNTEHFAEYVKQTDLAEAFAALSWRALAAEVMPRACKRARFLSILQNTGTQEHYPVCSAVTASHVQLLPLKLVGVSDRRHLYFGWRFRPLSTEPAQIMSSVAQRQHAATAAAAKLKHLQIRSTPLL